MGVFCAILSIKNDRFKVFSGKFLWGAVPGMDNKTHPYTTIHLHKTTWNELKRLKGKGVSHDRYIRNLIGLLPLERKANEKCEKEKEAGSR